MPAGAVSPDTPLPERLNQSATWEWPTAPILGAISSMHARAWPVEITYSHTGSRGLAW